jgi:dipeptidyl aminopeptidase/acylaminoacyl peptidase
MSNFSARLTTALVRSCACVVLLVTLTSLHTIFLLKATTRAPVATSLGKIAFASDRDGNFEIYTMDTDGGGQIRLTENPGEDYEPAWSPDGKRLAFVSTRDGNAEVYVMSADGSGQTRLTNNAGGDLRPAWSPDGSHIAFVTDRGGNDEIFLMTPDGANQTNLTLNPADDSSFSYSPDGATIVFSSKREDSQFDIFRMNADGSAVIRLTSSDGDDIDPSAGPQQIFFLSNRDENDEIYVMDALGQNQTRLTTNSDFDENPAQTGNGARIAFASSREGNFEIYAFNADGGGITRLTTNNATDIEPAVQPGAAIPPTPSAGSTIIQFSLIDFTANESAGSAILTVSRSGNSSVSASVDYATVNGTAVNRTDYIPNFNTLKFNPGETSRNIRILITDDAYEESDEVITVTLSNTSGAALGTASTATLTIIDNDTPPIAQNPIDGARFFVNQHYNDFLSRAPDQAGLDYWVNRINQCGSDFTCLRAQRNLVSAAFFIETEFQDSGFFVYRLYKGSLGVQPFFQQFIMDRSRVVGGPNLQQDKLALANDFVTRAAFTERYPAGQSPESFVDKLFDTAGLFPFTAERAQLAQDIRNGKTRAQAVIEVIDISQFKNREFNPAFVLMQYFGYLRRNADPAGYAFWLDVVNNREPNNYAGMVCAFITSAEYQQRFSSTVTVSNAQCAGVR